MFSTRYPRTVVSVWHSLRHLIVLFLDFFLRQEVSYFCVGLGTETLVIDIVLFILRKIPLHFQKHFIHFAVNGIYAFEQELA